MWTRAWCVWSRRFPGSGAAALLLSALLPVGCGNGSGPPPDSGARNDGFVGSSGPFDDLPRDPVMAGGLLPSDAASLASAFGAAGGGAPGGPCLAEPSLDAMVPRNLPPLLFVTTPPPSDNVVELRIHVDNQRADLVLYTDQARFTLPDAAWQGLQLHSYGHDLQITTRSTHYERGKDSGAVHLGSQGAVHLASVDAPGVVMYWTTTSGSAIKAFHIGDRKLTTLVTPDRMRSATPGDNTHCVGCHTSTPDGLLLVVGRGDNAHGGPFGVDARTIDGSAQRAPGAVVSPAAIQQLLREMQIMPTLSPAHYAASDAKAITIYDTNGRGTGYQILSTDLQNGNTTVLQRAGDDGQPDSPSFSHDGNRIAYTTSDGDISIYGSPAHTDVDTIPYDNGNGGTAVGLPGASSPDWNEYYPVYSPGDTFIAFNRIRAGTVVYNSPNAEVFIIPSAGGEAVRVQANDPPACTGMASPGLTNSWPRWAPAAAALGNQNFYWLVFSSARMRPPGGGPALPQLYVSAVVTSGNGTAERLVRSYPAVYLTTQSASEANHTPAWDELQIPNPG